MIEYSVDTIWHKVISYIYDFSESDIESNADDSNILSESQDESDCSSSEYGYELVDNKEINDSKNQSDKNSNTPLPSRNKVSEKFWTEVCYVINVSFKMDINIIFSRWNVLV